MVFDGFTPSPGGQEIETLMGACIAGPTLFILGAGAGAGFAPMYYDVRRIVGKRGWDKGNIYPELQSGERIYRLYPEPERRTTVPRYGFQSVDEYQYVLHSSPGWLAGSLMQSISTPTIMNGDNPYEFFSMAPPAVFFNYNIDGILERTCRGHIMFTPHGLVPPTFRNNKLLSTLIEYADRSQVAGERILETIKSHGIVLSQPEQKEITNRFEFVALLRLIPRSVAEKSASHDVPVSDRVLRLLRCVHRQNALYCGHDRCQQSVWAMPVAM